MRHTGLHGTLTGGSVDIRRWTSSTAHVVSMDAAAAHGDGAQRTHRHAGGGGGGGRGWGDQGQQAAVGGVRRSGGPHGAAGRPVGTSTYTYIPSKSALVALSQRVSASLTLHAQLKAKTQLTYPPSLVGWARAQVLDIHKRRWFLPPTQGDHCPGPRAFHCAVAVGR